jgi:hypothetical protein
MNTLEKEFVPYQESLELKELGFDEPCIMQWTYAPELIFCTSAWGRPKLKTNKESYSDSGGDCISAPTFSQAFRWFRENYGDFLRYDWGEVPHFLMIQIEMTKGKTYEEAELACLRKLIEIVKDGNK